MSTLAAKEEIVSCATCAQTRANGYSQRRLAVDVRADDFSRDDQFPFFCCDANGQTNDKQGGKKEAKLMGKNRGKWPEKTKRRVKVLCGGVPLNGLVLCQQHKKKRALSLFNNTYIQQRCMAHDNDTRATRTIALLLSLRVVTHSRCTLPTFPYPPAPLYSRRQPRLVK